MTLCVPRDKVKRNERRRRCRRTHPAIREILSLSLVLARTSHAVRFLPPVLQRRRQTPRPYTVFRFFSYADGLFAFRSQNAYGKTNNFLFVLRASATRVFELPSKNIPLGPTDAIVFKKNIIRRRRRRRPINVRKKNCNERCVCVWIDLIKILGFCYLYHIYIFERNYLKKNFFFSKYKVTHMFQNYDGIAFLYNCRGLFFFFLDDFKKIGKSTLSVRFSTPAFRVRL